MKKFVLIFFILSTKVFSQGVWTQKANFPASTRAIVVGFGIGSKGYIGTGCDASYYQDFWEWDQGTNTWTQKANFSGAGRRGAIGFAIGNKGYIGIGQLSSLAFASDFWEYDPSSNTWTQKASFTGPARAFGTCFSIGTKGYVGTGYSGTNLNDFWEWDQVTNTWAPKTSFPGSARWGPVGFSIGTKGYIGTGYGSGTMQDFWEWDQATDTWVQKANFGGTARLEASAFSLGTKGYITTGNDLSIVTQDFWEWDQGTNIWTQLPNFPGAGREYGIGFSVNCKGYVGTGWSFSDSQPYFNDFWEYAPNSSPCNTLNVIVNSQNVPCFGQCVGTATVTPSGGTIPYTYSWNNGQTNQVATGLCAGSYTITVTDSTGNTAITTAAISQPTALTSSIITTSATCGSSDGTATVNSSGGTSPYSYSWNNGQTAQTATGLAAGNYTVTITDANGCTSVISSMVNNTSGGTASILSSSNVNCNGGNNGSASAAMTGGTPNYTYAWNNGQTTSVATGLSAGNYSVTITDANGCISWTVVAITEPSAITASASSTNEICNKSDGTASVSPAGGTGSFTYLWNNGQTSQTATGLTAGNYSVVVSDSNSCALTQTITVNASSGMTVTASASPIVIIAGDSTQLSSTGGVAYQWAPSAGLSCITCQNPMASPSQTTAYCVTVTDSSGCTDSACIVIRVDFSCGNIFIPNAFSPNGDNENDVLKLYVEDIRCIREYRLDVFDRWGENVFETANPAEAWNGSFKNKMMDTQVLSYYCHIIFIDGKEVAKQGNISLVR